MGCPVGAGRVLSASESVAVHDASGDRSQWEGLVFADDSRGVDFQVQET